MKSPGKILGKREQNWLFNDTWNELFQGPNSKRTDAIIIIKSANTVPYSNQVVMLMEMSYRKI